MEDSNNGSVHLLGDQSSIDYFINLLPQTVTDNYHLILAFICLIAGGIQALKWISLQVITAIGGSKKAYYNEMVEVERKILEREKVRAQRRELESKYFSGILKRIHKYLQYRKTKLDGTKKSKELTFIEKLSDEIKDVL